MTAPAPAGGRLIVALDLPDPAAARALVGRLGDAVGYYKIGMALLFERETQALIDALLEAGKRVFLDHKMYDIPQTVRSGVAAMVRRGVHMVTVHGDPAILAAAAEAAAGSTLEVMAVTVLTSQDDASVRAMGSALGVADLVALRARAAARAGVAGVIASAADDIASLKALGLRVVTPGIRLPCGAAGDQKRIATPDEAIARGADYLVVGRPILAAPDPRQAAEAVLRLMAGAAGQGAAS